MARQNIRFARDTVSVRTPGSKYPTLIHKGEAWYADHPIVTSHPDLFAVDHPDVQPRGWVPEPAEVEQATAAPGEKRATRRVSED